MKKRNICAVVLASVMLLSAVACSSDDDSEETTSEAETTQSVVETEEPVATSADESTEDTQMTEEISAGEDVTASTESTDTTESEEIESTDETELEILETIVFEGEGQRNANVFLTNFAEQNFHEAGAADEFDVWDEDNVSAEELLTFVYFHIKINNFSEFEIAQSGELTYVTFTVDKAIEVIHKYMNNAFLLTEEDCQAFPAPPSSMDNISFGPFYQDGKIWFMSGDGDIHSDIAVVDYAINTGDGTLTFYFKIYNINYETVESPDFAGFERYYSLTPAEAANDPTLEYRGSGVANAAVGQFGNYNLNTYDVDIGA